MIFSLRTVVALLACATVVGCADDEPPPPRGVESLLLYRGTAEDTVPATVMRKHRDLMRSLAARDGRASSYLSMEFRFASASGPSSTSSVVKREQDYFQTLAAGLPAEVVGVTDFRLQEYGDKFATMNARISPTRSVFVVWMVITGEWKAKSVQVFDHDAKAARPELGTVRVIGRRAAQ